MNNVIKIKVEQQELPFAGEFRIARGAKTSAKIIVVTLSDSQYLGTAESVPYARYGEDLESVSKQITMLGDTFSDERSLKLAIDSLPAGSARNALDCAWFDFVAKKTGQSVQEKLELSQNQTVICAQTLSLDTAENMANAVAELGLPPLIKVKLDNQDILVKMQAIAAAAPNSQFIVDANEGWSIEDLKSNADALAKLNVVLIEQPLPADEDEALLGYNSPVTLCADESCHTSDKLSSLKGKYQAINIKLDKTGGLSEAIKLAKAAQAQGFEIMVGCMVGSSLAMAPAYLLHPFASYVDLDGPIFLKADRAHGFTFKNGQMSALNTELWG